MELQMNRQPENPVTIRQSNFELLRILSMLMIVAHHFAVHGGLTYPDGTLSLNRAWVQWIQMGGKIGVDVFVLISGFFLISAKSFKAQKILKLLAQTLTYSILIFAIVVGTGSAPFRVHDLIVHCFPTTFSLWWFASTYFVLYLLSPFLNKLLNSFDKKQYKQFLLILFGIWCIIPTFTAQKFQSNNLLWFVFLYAVSGYIRKFDPLRDIRASRWLLLSLCFVILTYASAIIFDMIGTRVSAFSAHATYFYEMEKLPILLISVTLFLGFRKLEVRHSRFINTISAATYGVYLIHDEAFLRPLIWRTLFKVGQYSDSVLLIPYSLLVIAVVFILCTMIELFRIHVLEKNYMQLLGKLSDFIDRKMETLLSSNWIEKI